MEGSNNVLQDQRDAMSRLTDYRRYRVTANGALGERGESTYEHDALLFAISEDPASESAVPHFPKIVLAVSDELDQAPTLNREYRHFAENHQERHYVREGVRKVLR